jgi:predicted methyltransferase
MTARSRTVPVLTLALLLAPSISGAVTAEEVAARLAAGERSSEDRARDADRRPAEVIAFLGIAPGMTVLDLIAAGGWYSEALALAVGPDGRVYAQNSRYVLEMRDGANDRALSARLAGGRLTNVERLDREMGDLGLEPGSIDAAFTALNFHDVYNGRGPEAALSFLATVHGLLKPGGVMGIVDHAGGVGDDAELHRIDETLVVGVAEKAGFRVEATSPALRHPQDDRTRNVFAPGLRGKTDRFVLRLRKPSPESAPPRP